MRSKNVIDWLCIALLTVAVFASACASASEWHDGGGKTHQVEREPSDPYVRPPAPVPVDAAEACPDWRWIGVMTAPEGAEDEPHGIAPRDPGPPSYPGRKPPGPVPEPGPCPPFPDADPLWQIRPLFADATPALAKYCLYEHPDRGEDLEAYPKPEGLAEIARDCMTVFPLAEPTLHESVATPLEQRFLRQAGRRGRDAFPVVGSPVRLAVIDTAPTNGDDPRADKSNSPHGFSLVHMADHLLCGPGSACVVHLTTQLALAYVDYNRWTNLLSIRDEVHGGYIGMQSDLAQAIRHEVVAWGGSGKLVLNHSIGWHPRGNDVLGVPAALEPPVRAIYEAIEDAVCRGALVVAAAGNTDWGPQPGQGPLLPAAWEQRAAPSVAECVAAHGGAGAVAISDGGTYRPLLHAVGGVQADGSDLLNARAGARPRLVAFGDHAVVDGVPPYQPTTIPTDQPPGTTGILTGTSVSALVGSVAAAAAWHYRQARVGEPWTIVQEIYDRSERKTLSKPAEFCLGEACTDSRRIFVCLAAKPERGARVPSCRAVEDYPTSVVDEMVIDESTLENALTGAPEPTVAGYVSTTPPAPCGARIYHYDASSGPARYACPHDQLASVTVDPWLDPLPESIPCPPCTDGSLFIEIASAFAGRELSDPTLEINDRLYSLSFPLDAKEAYRARVRDLDIQPGDEVLLSFVVDGRRSAVCPVLVVANP